VDLKLSTVSQYNAVDVWPDCQWQRQ